MGKTKIWNVNVNGTDNEVAFTLNLLSGKRTLTVNEKEIELKKGLYETFIGIDQPVDIAGKECRFVLIGNHADIAVDGIYLDTGKSYTPIKSLPRWAWIFIVLCFALPIASLGGAIPTVLAALGAIFCVKVAMLSNMKTPVKVLCCFGITLLVWILFGVSMLAFAFAHF